MLAKLLYSDDTDTLVDALSALSCITNIGDASVLRLTVQAGVSERLVDSDLLRHESLLVQFPAMRTLRSIDDSGFHTQIMINFGALDSLTYVLQPRRGKRALKKDSEACWVLSSVTNSMAGSKEQIQAAFNANLVHQLVQILGTGHRDVKGEACRALCNATSGGSPDQVLSMVRKAVIPELVAMSEDDDANIGLVALEGLENIMRAGETMARLGRVPEGMMFVPDMLSRLMSYPPEDGDDAGDADISRKAENMLQKWFPHWKDEYAGGAAEELDDGGGWPSSPRF